MAPVAAPASSLPVLQLPILSALVSGKTSLPKEQELLTSLATKDPTVFAEARQEIPALKALPADITTHEELRARALAASQSKPVTHGVFTAKVGQEIKALFNNETWAVPFNTVIGGFGGFLGGWGLGAALGASLGEVLNKPLGMMGGDYLSVLAIPIIGYLVARAEPNGELNSAEKQDTNLVAAHDKAIKALSPLTALAMGATFFVTRSYESWGEDAHMIAVAALSIAAAFGASIIGSLVMPPILQDIDNVKARFKHWNESRKLKNALHAFEKIGLSPERLTGQLRTDTARLAAFASGPLTDYLTEERNKLRDQRDLLTTNLARVRAGKESQVLFTEKTPAAQRERVLAKLTHTEERLLKAIERLDRDGIAVFENTLQMIPKLLADISEWDRDQSDVTELAALETLADVGEDKADDAEIMLNLSRERLGALADRLDKMISDIRAARRAAIEVERVSPPIPELQKIKEPGAVATQGAQQRQSNAQGVG